MEKNGKSSENQDIAMNEELKNWLKETKSETSENQSAKEVESKPSGKCQICGEKDAKFVCLKCDKFVCSACYFKIIGICKKCVPKDIAQKWEGKNPDWEQVLGVEWVG